MPLQLPHGGALIGPYNHGDTPACVQPIGLVLTMVTDDQSGVATRPGFFYELNPYAPKNSQWASVPYPVSSGQVGNPERTRILALPAPKPNSIGQLLVSGVQGSPGTFWLYTPDTSVLPAPSWRPTITSPPVLFFGSFILSGSQLNGLTTGGDFGDDGKVATNFPIVSLVNSSGNVSFGRTIRIDQMAPRRAPNANGTCWFTTPFGLPNGTYTVQVSASGLGVDPNTAAVQLTIPAVDMGPAVLSAIDSTLI